MHHQEMSPLGDIQSRESRLFAALGYENPEVVERFKDKLGLDHEKALELFTDVKKFLFVCATYDGPEPISPTKKIDAGWHEFLLYTQDYQDFCETYFGRFIHHQPRSYIFKEPSCLPLRYATYNIAEDILGKLGPNWGASADELAKCGDRDCSRSKGPRRPSVM